MKRLTSVAAASFLLAATLVTAQVPPEMVLTHLVGEEETGTSRLLVSPSEIRVKAEGRAKEGAPATELLALLQRSETGWLKRYDRELKSSKDGLVLSSVSVVADGETLSFRETGTIGTRRKTLAAVGLDFVVDAAAPEIFIPYLSDAGRKQVRVLILPDLEVKTVVLEERSEGGRFAALPGGGVTLMLDAAGGFRKLVLPGPGERVIVRAGSPESRPAPPKGRETQSVLSLDGGVRIALTLTLPAEGDGPFPGVVLIGDAGPRNRQGVGGGALVPTLRLLADELAAAGIASVRADKRGTGQSAGPDPDLAALTADAKALLDVIALHPGIDPARVFVAGHGEGAVVAASLAAAVGKAHKEGAKFKLAGIIALGGPARPLAEALEARLRIRLAAAGQSQDSIDGTVLAFRTEIETLRELPPGGQTKPGQALLRDLVKIDPAVQLAAVRAPLLVLHAGDDREVPASQVALLRASLAFSGERARFEIVDGADHDLLMTSTSSGMTGSEPQTADVARELHPRFSALIREFIGRGAASRISER